MDLMGIQKGCKIVWNRDLQMFIALKPETGVNVVMDLISIQKLCKTAWKMDLQMFIAFASDTGVTF